MKKREHNPLSTFGKPLDQERKAKAVASKPSISQIMEFRSPPPPPSKTKKLSPPPPQLAIRKPKQILYSDLPPDMRSILEETLRFSLPEGDVHKRYSLWKTHKNWGALLQVYGSSMPLKGVKNMVINVKWKFKGGILEPCRGYIDLVKAINSPETKKLSAYLP